MRWFGVLLIAVSLMLAAAVPAPSASARSTLAGEAKAKKRKCTAKQRRKASKRSAARRGRADCRKVKRKKPKPKPRPAKPKPASKPAAPVAAPDPCPLAAPRTYDPIGKPGAGFPDDPLFGAQWALPMVDAPAAWKTATGRGAVIAIIDSGVDLHHPDLRDKLVPGIDLVDKDACPDDTYGHGTFVAGIAAAATNNALGVAGAAPGASIMPIRVSADGPVRDTEIIDEAVHWAVDHGADVINISMGGKELYVGLGEDGMPFAEMKSHEAAYAWSKGAVIVGAAGNETLPFCSNPAGTVHVLCVAAVDPAGNPAVYSNLPVSPENGVAVQAPGGDPLYESDQFACFQPGLVWSTVPTVSRMEPPDCEHPPNAYAAYSGTSAAAPFVAAQAALLFSLGLDNEQVVARIRDTASNQGRYDPVTGYGLVDFAAAVNGS